ncbi:MAG TPA: helix-turn-helix domain-containing protein [Gemmataceae bacterium]|nr:helix-turn-helix domain-containing protein [Gemmataceae bacterium]
MKANLKLTGEERKAAIINVARRAFAEKGFHGTTTRELANAAGVSEALLFKHFPTKEALYSAMMQAACQEKNPEMYQRMQALEPSTSTLVLLVHIMVGHMVGKVNSDDQSLQTRLILRSLAEDGEFARLFLERIPGPFVRKIEESINAAIASGDAVDGWVQPHLRARFANALVAMIRVHLTPIEPAVDYGVSGEKLVEQVVWFVLRGVGLTDEAIKRHYNPQTLALFFG